jgi:hypothetical protein
MATKGEGHVMCVIIKTKTGPYGNLRDKGCEIEKIRIPKESQTRQN